MSSEYINKVELQGRVGSVRISSVSDKLVADFSIYAERVSKTREGQAVVEATWMSVAAFKGGDVSIDGLTRGSLVHLKGPLRNIRCTDATGSEKVFTEVIADSLEVLE